MTFALEFEFAPWRNLRRFRKTSLGNQLIHTVGIGSSEVWVAITGIGCGHAERVASAVLSSLPDACISAGLAGSLAQIHSVGDLLAASTVVSSSESSVLNCDARLLDLAASCGAKRVPAFVTSASVVLTAGEKRRLAAVAEAVEMESYGVLKAANNFGIPAVAVRAVSDEVDEDLPLDFNRVTDGQGHVSKSKLFSELAARPHRIPALVRLGRSGRRAADRLAGFLDAYVGVLAGQSLRAAALSEVAAE